MTHEELNHHMATNAKTTTSRTRGSSARSTSARRTTAKTTSTAGTSRSSRTDASQVREGVTKARHGAAAIVRQGAERAVDVPVGAALTARDRVADVRDRVTGAIEPLTSTSGREKELKSLRTQVTRELNKFERRGGQARRKATQGARTTRNRVEREVKSTRREVEKTVKQNRTKAERRLKKAQKVVKERVPVGS